MAGFLQSSRRQEALLDPHQRKRQVAAELQELHKQGSELLGTCVPRASTSEAERFAQLLNATRSQSKSTTVDEEILNRWRTALEDPQIRRPDHPLYLWYVMSERRDAWPGVDAWAEQSRRFQQLTNAKDENVNAPLVTDFATKDFGGWLVAGDAFTEAPTSAQQWDRYEEQPQFHRPTVAHSGRIGRKLMGVLRSPTFTITHRNIFYRLAGQDAEVRLIVDGYVMIEFHQLLFAGLKFPVKSPDGFTWHRQSGDLHKYLGHRAHLELVDSGDGWLAVDEVRFSDEPIPEPLRNPLGRQIAAKEQVSDWQELAHAYGEVWNNTLHAWHEGESEESGIRLINWMFRHGLIFSDRGKLEQTKLELDRIRQRMNECERSLPEPMRVTAICDGSGENESVHVRGNHRTLGDQVPRRLLEALGGVGPLPTEEGSGRLQLARRMVHPHNPLTAGGSQSNMAPFVWTRNRPNRR